MPSPSITVKPLVKSHHASKPGKPREHLMDLRSLQLPFELSFSNNAEFIKAPNENKYLVNIHLDDTDPEVNQYITKLLDNHTYVASAKDKAPVSLRISEGRGNGLRATIVNAVTEFVVDKCGVTGSAENPGKDFIIQLHLRDEKKFKLRTEFDEKNFKPGSANRDAIWKSYAMTRTLPQQKKYVVELCSHVRIIIRKYQDISKPHLFSENVVHDMFFDADSPAQLSRLPNDYYRLQLGAIEAEIAHGNQLKSQLARKDQVSVRVKPIPTLPGRLCFELEGPPNWNIQGQTTMRIRPSKKLPNDAGVINRDPGPPADGKPTQGTWEGTTFLLHGKLHCSIENLIIPSNVKRLEDNEVANKVLLKDLDITFPVDEDDPFIKVISAANVALNHVMCHELNAIPADRTEHTLPKDYRVKIHNLFLHKTTEANDTSPIPLRMGVDLENVVNDSLYQLSHPSQRNAVRMVFKNELRRSVIQGPPATGKTTIVSKIVALIRKFSPLKANSVVTAHTNEAVRVACARYLEISKNMFREADPSGHVCLVVSKRVANYWILSNKPLDPNIEKCTNWAHMDRLADRDKSSYPHYIAARKNMKETGRFHTPDKFGGLTLGEEMTELSEKLKTTIKVWFATMATINFDNGIFGISEGKTGIDTGLLVIDEASQATDLYIAGVILTLDPRALLFAGDHKQLAPHCSTPEAENIWGTSIFEQLINHDGSIGISKTPQVMLGAQYRTHSRIYAGTNAHYNNVVQTPAAVNNRPHGRQIEKNIRRIHMVDSKGVKIPLTSIVHFFNITNSKCFINPVTASSENQAEVDFVYGLIRAMFVAEIAPEDIMAITGYQGQYDLLMNAQTRLPARGIALRKIDGAQGDESNIVILLLVRTLALGLAFMWLVKRQNVGTSRAREAFYLVGDFNLILNTHNGYAWQIWYNGLASANDNLKLDIVAPVKWFVDDRFVDITDNPDVGEDSLRVYSAPAASYSSGAKMELVHRQKFTDQFSHEGSPQASGVGSHQGSQAQHNRSVSGSAPVQHGRTPSGNTTPQHARTPSGNMTARPRGDSTGARSGVVSPHATQSQTPTRPQRGAFPPQSVVNTTQHSRTASGAGFSGHTRNSSGQWQQPMGSAAPDDFIRDQKTRYRNALQTLQQSQKIVEDFLTQYGEGSQGARDMVNSYRSYMFKRAKEGLARHEGAFFDFAGKLTDFVVANHVETMAICQWEMIDARMLLQQAGSDVD